MAQNKSVWDTVKYNVMASRRETALKRVLRATRGGLLGLIAFLAGATIHFAQTTPHFPPPLSPGETIKRATEAAAATRVSTGPIEILSDTQGTDFGPYLQAAIAKVRQNWYKLIPRSAEMEKGKLAIEFAVLKNGHISDMKLVATSGNTLLDRAAWGGITISNPFPPLPAEFNGSQLALRFRFYYNPDGTDIEPTVTHVVLNQKLADSNPLKYPKDALDAKIEGMVRLEGLVTAQGQITDLRVMEGDKGLSAAATEAVSKWRFHPAKKNGKDIEERVHIKVVFRLDGEKVRTQVSNLPEELK